MQMVVSVVCVLLACSVQWFFFRLFLRRDELPVGVRLKAVLWGALGAGLVSVPICALFTLLAVKLYHERHVQMFFASVIAGPPMEEMAKALFPLFACVALGVRVKRQLLVLGALSGDCS